MLLLNQSVNSIDHVQITSDGMIHFNEIINFDIYTADLSGQTNLQISGSDIQVDFALG